MSNKKHALLSASGADRWLICTPSARLSSSKGEGESIYADEGTLAHEISEWRIKEVLFGLDLSNHINKLMQHDLFQEEMMDYVNEYAEFVVEKIRNAPAGAMFVQEHQVNLRDWIPDGFGTTDVSIASDEYLEVIDLKYGKGVPVDAYENGQMLVYALGVHRDFGILFNYKKIRLTIYQPRIGNISTYETDITNLFRWANEVLRPTALRAYEGIGELVPGDHCRFCKLKPTCAAFAKFNLEVAKREFDITEMTDDQIVKVLSRSKQIKNWLTSVENYALKESLTGRKFPGIKLVEGRSNRVVQNPEKLKETLIGLGLSEEQFMESKILGTTKMTKLLGSKKFRENVEQYLFKPPGKPTLVDLEDKRPEYDRNAAASLEFEEIKDDDE